MLLEGQALGNPQDRERPSACRRKVEQCAVTRQQHDLPRWLPFKQQARGKGHGLSLVPRGLQSASKLSEVPANVTLDAFAAYSFGRYRVSLNVYNLADRLNYTQVFGNRGVPAAGRTVIVSLGATF